MHNIQNSLDRKRARTKSQGSRRKFKLNKLFGKQKYKFYLNETGPGEYEIANLWGTLNKTQSKINTGPFYSFAARCKTPIISKHHTQDLKGKGGQLFLFKYECRYPWTRSVCQRRHKHNSWAKVHHIKI